MTVTPEPGSMMPLAEGFEPQDRAQWQNLVAAVLNKGRPDDKQLTGPQAAASLRTQLAGDVTVEALYVRPDQTQVLGLPGQAPFTRGDWRPADRPWDLRQLHDDPDPALTAREVLADLERGASSVWLHIGADGLAVADVAAALEGVDLDAAPVAVTSWTDPYAAAETLLGLLQGRLGGGSLGLDPLGVAARLGAAPDLGRLAELTRQGLAAESKVAPITVDTRVYHDAGASEVDEIAFAAATGVAYLRHLETEGLAPTDVWRGIELRVPATADQFLTTAKLRALRRVWARVGELCGVPEAARGVRVHAVTSSRMLTRDDPWVNILRGTLAAFGATVGGADTLTVLPFDTVAGLPTAFSRRVARNTSVLLSDESNVGRVSDPAGGSWYVESLTDELATKAWSAFQEVERAGGMAKALASRWLARRLEDTALDRDEAIATRRLPMTGVSMFPNAAEARLERTPRATVPAAAVALLPRRDSEAFEAMRDQAATSHAALRIVTLGEQRDYGARETFVRNLLAAGGIAVRDDAPSAVLVSSPKVYAAQGAAAIARLKAEGVPYVLVAGRATELGEAAEQVHGEIFDGMDVVKFYGHTHHHFAEAVTAAENGGRA